jgi:RecA/RadA recombinase
LGGQSVYVDTKLDYSAYRLQQIAEGCVNRLEKQEPNRLGNFNTQFIMDNVFIFEVTTDYTELFAVVLSLDSFLESKPNVRLIVIDSFSYLLRYELDSLERTRLTNQLMTYLHMLAKNYNVAVLLTHEMTTRVDGPEDARTVPALGEGGKKRAIIPATCQTYLQILHFPPQRSRE